MSPFDFDVARIVPYGHPFCGREKEKRLLLENIRRGVNSLIYGPRRFGKSSLIEQVVNPVILPDTLQIKVDFLGVTTPHDVVARLAKAFYTAHRPSPLEWIKKAASLLPGIRPNLDLLALSSDGDASFGRFSVSVANDPYQKLIEEVLEGILKAARELEQQVVVVLDEFQDITALKEAPAIEGLMRGLIQRQTGKEAVYVFAGSKKHLLLAMFGRQRPFFKAAQHMEVGLLAQDDVRLFINAQTERFGKTIDPATVEFILKSTMGHPYHMMNVLSMALSSGAEVIDAALARAAVEVVMESETLEVSGWVSSLTVNQRKALRTLAIKAASEPVKPFSQETLREAGLTPSQMTRALDSLAAMGKIEKTLDGYRLDDPVEASCVLKILGS